MDGPRREEFDDRETSLGLLLEVILRANMQIQRRVWLNRSIENSFGFAHRRQKRNGRSSIIERAGEGRRDEQDCEEQLYDALGSHLACSNAKFRITLST